MAARRKQKPRERVPAAAGNPVFAAQLRNLLADRRMTSTALSKRMSISPQAVSQWLSLQTAPSNKRVAQVAKILGVPTERFSQAPGAETGPPIKEIASTPAKDPHGGHREDRPAQPGWRLPEALLKELPADVKLVMMVVPNDELRPVLHSGDCLFLDLACRKIVNSGVYLLASGDTSALRFCRPLIGGKVQVEYDGVKQVVDSGDGFTIAGKAIWRFTRL